MVASGDRGAHLRAALVVLFAAGLVVRLGLVAVTEGSAGDLGAFRGVRDVLAGDRWHLYSLLNVDGRFAWPYLPGYFPVVEITGRAAAASGIAFERLIRLPPVAADLAIAWIVQWHLGWRGAGDRVRLAAAALLVVSPVGIAFTAAHGQVDPVEWLPVVLAVVVWDRAPARRRAVLAGLLLGLAVAIKTPAVFGLAGLLALAPRWGERARLLAAAAVIPLLAVAPFAVADLDGVLGIADYQSIAGQGGVSLIVQPALALARFAGEGTTEHSALQDVVQALSPALTVVGLLAAMVWVARRRPAPEVAVAVPVLVVLVLGANFIPLYAIWVLAFAVLAGWWRFVLVAHVAVLFTLPFKYVPVDRARDLGFSDGALYDAWAVSVFYVPAAIVLTVACGARLVLALRERPAAPGSSGAGTAAPRSGS